jgi:UTP--glucose-1-phosphate uridylyltransferase
MTETKPSLDAQLAALPSDVRATLARHRFDAGLLRRLAARLGTESAADNFVTGKLSAPRPEDLGRLPAAGSSEHARLTALGEGALREGRVALLVLAGGMATRMGGVVKALVEAFDGHTFLDLRLRENATWSARAGRPVPLWLMTSDATDGPTREALKKANAPAHVATFRQDVGLRLTPEGSLFRDEHGAVSTYSPGHGDLPDALRRSGLLERFVASPNGGGSRTVWIANLDNLGASIDSAILGLFMKARPARAEARPARAQTAADVMVEVAPKEAGDKGGIPAWADTPDGRRLQVLEEFRLPPGFDAASVRVFNTNTFLVRAEPLLRAPIHWNWFEVEKKVDGRTAVQFERLLQELTAAMPAAYVRVPREGDFARFLPVKDHEELARRREAIRQVAAARGMT